MSFKIIVCGGRTLRDKKRVSTILSHIKYQTGLSDHGPLVIIHGGATGADTLAAEWCLETSTKMLAYPAQWKLHGRAAGPIRNKKMLDEHKVDLVVAFWDGYSRGTLNMISLAVQAGVGISVPPKEVSAYEYQ